MKQAMRLQQAVRVLLPFIEAALKGRPLPVHTDADFERFAEAVTRCVHGDDHRWMGKAVAAVLGEHVLANLQAQRELAPKE